MGFFNDLFSPSRLELQIMGALEDLQGKISDLDLKVEAANAKADALIAGYNAQKTQISQLLAQGAGATQAQLQQLSDQLDNTAAKLTQQANEDDAALAP